MQSYVMSAPVYNTNSANMKTFPQLGAFPGEVGSGNSPGGIGGTWNNNIPLAYWYTFGGRRSRKGGRRGSRKGSRKSRSRKSKKGRKSNKCKKYLSKKIGINIREGYPRKRAIAISYSQTKKKFPRCKF